MKVDYTNPKLRTRFMKRVIKTESCWLWNGRIDKLGYAVFNIGYKRPKAHRTSYLMFVGPIPSGLILDHLCSVRHCVNPAHLEAVTHRTNTMRGNTVARLHAQKTHCKNGHAFDEKNTLIRPNGNRACRACGLIAVKKYQQKLASGAPITDRRRIGPPRQHRSTAELAAKAARQAGS